MPTLGGVYIDGLKEARRAVRKLPDDGKAELKQRARDIAFTVADEAERRFIALGHQGPLISATVRVGFTADPVIRVGGSAGIGRNKKPAYKLLYGTEFGSNDYPQFHASHTGQVGRALFPTVRDKTPYMIEQWAQALDDVVSEFGKD